MSAARRKTRASNAAEVSHEADKLSPLVDAAAAPSPHLSTSLDNGAAASSDSTALVPHDRTESGLLSTLAGRPYSWRRTVTAFVLAFVTATLVRQACFSSPVFGGNLAKNLAPIERTDVEWSIVALGEQRSSRLRNSF
jgi:hypothetical protein